MKAGWGYVVSLGLLIGCAADRPWNPSFPLRQGEAKQALKKMAKEPVTLARPVVVLGGFLDPGFMAAGGLRDDLAEALGDDHVLGVTFATCGDFEACRAKLIEAVEEAYPSGDPNATHEVDVVAFSMGGLIARYAAIPQEGQPRLNMTRLFTISTPHQGASLAGLPALNALHKDMRPGSDLLTFVDQAWEERGYELYPYVRLGDAVVGSANAAPSGRTAWWVPNPPLHLAHLGAAHDARILADIARRLRHEPPWTTLPPAPLPTSEPSDDLAGPLPVNGSSGG